jgi:hypothetical protein
VRYANRLFQSPVDVRTVSRGQDKGRCRGDLRGFLWGRVVKIHVQVANDTDMGGAIEAAFVRSPGATTPTRAGVDPEKVVGVFAVRVFADDFQLKGFAVLMNDSYNSRPATVRIPDPL